MAWKVPQFIQAKFMRSIRESRISPLQRKVLTTLSIYLCIRILKNQNYGNKGILRKGDAGL